MFAGLTCALGLLVSALGGGPTLSDADFFTGLKLDQPGLEAVAAAVQRQDWPAARAAYAAHFRSREKPRWFTGLRQAPTAPAKRPNTDEADRQLAHQWAWSGRTFDLGPDIDWASNQMTEGESATVEWNASLNRHFHFRHLATAYERTGEEKYAAEIVAQLLDWIADCPVLADRSGNSPYHHAWETLNTAVRAGDTWPDALYRILPSKSLTDDALVTIVKSLVEHARHLDRWPTKSGNWLTMESTALVVVGTLVPEFREADTWRAHGIERLHRQMQTDVYPDGLEIELALGYNNWVVRNFASVLELATLNDRVGELPSDYLAQLERMYEYQACAAMPDGMVPGLNDSGNASAAGLLEAGYRYFPGRDDFLFVATGGKQGKQPTKTSVAFPYCGHYVMRSGWDRDARYLLFDAGPFGSGHQHEDKLHLVAYAYGRQLLLDAGNYMYDHSRWRRYVLSTRGHNTIRVDGEDQCRRRKRDTWVLPLPFQPLENTWASGERFDLAVGRYDSGYGPQGEIGVTHTRAVVFVKPDYWVVVDTLVPDDTSEHRYESLWHLNGPAAHVVETTKAVLTDSANEANLLVWPLATEGLSVEVVQGREEELVQGWGGSPWRAVPTAVLGVKGAGRMQMVTVLYPLAAGAAPPIEAVEPVPVTVDGQPAGDAVALRIRFRDGRTDTLLVADRPGVRRAAGSLETAAAVHGTITTSQGTTTFQYP